MPSGISYTSILKERFPHADIKYRSIYLDANETVFYCTGRGCIRYTTLCWALCLIKLYKMTR
jgi:hypothetical protein